jgi:hypothetical protein
MGMLAWIGEHSGALNVLLSAAMLVVWLFYLQGFLQSFRRERRPRILINRGGGSGPHAHCLLSNMSAEAIYIHSLVAKLNSADKETFAAVTDLVGSSDDEATFSLKESTLQGPVAAGEFLDVGTFENILRRAGWTTTEQRADTMSKSEPIELELTALATYRSEDLIVGASRRFGIEPGDNDWTIKPSTADTQQIRSRRQRRALHKAYTDYLN